MRKFYSLSLCLAVAAVVCASPARMPRQSRAIAGPVAKEATNVTENGFTANWEPVAGAEGYSVLVWGMEVAPADGVYTVLQEDFNLISYGSIVEPVQAEDYYIDLSDENWDCVWSPGWAVAGYAMFAGGKVNGVIYTPYMDLTNDGGKFTAVLGIQGYAGQEIVVASCGETEALKKVRLTREGYSEIRVDFDNGVHDSYLRIVDNGFPDADDPYEYMENYAYLDDFAVEQHLKKGDEVLIPVDVNDAVDAPKTSADFSNLRFRAGRDVLYYDVIAAFREYDDPDDPWSYDQWYSEYSALQRVELLGYDSVEAVEADNASEVEIYSISGAKYAAGTELPAGVYIVKSGHDVKKIIVK